jgi:hypothetical protein
MAKGIDAKAPPQPFGSGSRENASQENLGSVTPAKSSSSPTATTVTSSSKVADARTPRRFTPVKTR